MEYSCTLCLVAINREESVYHAENHRRSGDHINAEGAETPIYFIPSDQIATL